MLIVTRVDVLPHEVGNRIEQEDLPQHRKNVLRRPVHQLRRLRGRGQPYRNLAGQQTVGGEGNTWIETPTIEIAHGEIAASRIRRIAGQKRASRRQSAPRIGHAFDRRQFLPQNAHLRRDRDHHVEAEDRLPGPHPAPEPESALPQRSASLGTTPDRLLTPAPRPVQGVPQRLAQRQP